MKKRQSVGAVRPSGEFLVRTWGVAIAVLVLAACTATRVPPPVPPAAAAPAPAPVAAPVDPLAAQIDCYYQRLDSVISKADVERPFVWRSGGAGANPSCEGMLPGAHKPTADARAARFNLAGDSLFPFGGSSPQDLMPAGREMLSALARDMQRRYVKDASFGVQVTGHTDRLGGAAANRRLSQARALTVRNYLIERGGLLPASVQARGVGATQPAVQCADTLGRAARIACLAPNRRVELVVTGMR